MPSRTVFLWLTIALLAVPGTAYSQTFQFRAQQGSTVSTVSDSGTVSISAEAAGRPALSSLTATYVGTSGIAVSRVAIGGGSEFVLMNMPSMPQVLFAGQSFSFSLLFQPANSARSTAQLYVYLSDSTSVRTVVLNLVGTAPDTSLGYIMPPENNFVSLPAGGTLEFPATSVNSSITTAVVIGNRGSGAGAVNAISVTGAAFRLTGLPALPASLEPGREMRFGIVYSPSQAGASGGTLSIACADKNYLVQLRATTSPPDFSLAYYFPSDGNVISVSSGATLVFPTTKAGASSNAVVTVGNRGGGGYVSAISLSARSFQLSGVPPLPLFVETGKELRFGVVFSPQDLEPATGVLKIVVDDRTVVLNLDGRASGPRFSYEVIGNGTVSPFHVGAKLSLPDTPLRQTSNLAIQVRNTGNAEGAIAGVSVTGDGFHLSNVPILPYTLQPNSAVLFQVQFTPTQPGPVNGRLRIGADSFELEATAQGSKLVFFYITGGTTIDLLESRNLLWPPTAVGQTSQIDLIIRNSGTTPAAVTPIMVVDARYAFRLTSPPELPATIESNAQLLLPVTFSPVAVGDNSARLRIGTETFTLMGTGTPPPDLPAVELRGPARIQEPLQQRPVSLLLSQPYPLPLTGTLSLTFNSTSYSVDPAVQFSSGGRSVAFTIPANETQAQFPTGSEVYFQTGSVAGTINLRASFATLGINVTPEVPPGLDVVIPPGPPQVLDVQLSAQSLNSLAVVVTGLATTRSLDQLELQFVSSPKFSVPGGKFTISVASASGSWYRSRDSEAYGSLFTASVPFTVQNGNSLNLGEVFQSVSATLTNERGRSNTLSVTPRP